MASYTTKRFFSLSLALVLIAILSATFTSSASASAAPAKSTSSTAHWTRATARNLKQLFPTTQTFQATVGTNALTCFSDSIQSYQNSYFVSTEIGYSGSQYAMLRARASVLGP